MGMPIQATVEMFVCTFCLAKDGRTVPASVVSTFSTDVENSRNFGVRFRTFRALEFVQGASEANTFAACVEHEDDVIGERIIPFITGLSDITEIIAIAEKNALPVDDTPNQYEGENGDQDDDEEDDDQDDSDDEEEEEEEEEEEIPQIHPEKPAAKPAGAKVVPTKPNFVPTSGRVADLLNKNTPKKSAVNNPRPDQVDADAKLPDTPREIEEWETWYPSDYEVNTKAPQGEERDECEKWFIRLPRGRKTELAPNGFPAKGKRGAWPAKLVPAWRTSREYAEYMGYVTPAS